jgi:hypothetical protein
MLKIKNFITVVLALCFIYNINASQNNKVSNYFTIDIVNLNFIYLTTTGTIQDSFEDEIKTIVDFANGYSLDTSRIVVVFVDNIAPLSNPKQEKYNILNSDNKNLVIDEEFLIKEYGIAYLQSKRKVLVGVLVFPFVNLQETDEIKFLNFTNMKASGFSVAIPKETDQVKLNPYDKNMRSYNRTVALKKLAQQKDQNNFSVFEITDIESGGVSYLNFPINKNDILQLYQKYKPTEENNQ